MGDEAEIFNRLSRIEQTCARIDERTARHDTDHTDHEQRIRALELSNAGHVDHEQRIRTLENDSNKGKGIAAGIALAATAIIEGALWLFKHFVGGAS